MIAPGKPEFPRDVVQEVFLEILHRLDPQPSWEWDGRTRPVHCRHALCEQVCATGGYRRGKQSMKDLEILYVPRMGEEADPGDLFGAARPVNLTDRLLEVLQKEGIIERRRSTLGQESWGPLNKFARHLPTGLPIDFFATKRENWHNRLVVTTGPKELNVKIAGTARERGWEWEVYQGGFVPKGMIWETAKSERRTMRSELEVFEFVGMSYVPPQERRAL